MVKQLVLSWSQEHLRFLDSPCSHRPLSGKSLFVVVIESKALIRDCITCSLRTRSNLNVLAVATVEEWLELSKTEDASLIVFYAHGKAVEEEIRLSLETLAQAACLLPVVILADYDNVERVVDAIGKGARGYIPTDMRLEVAVEVIKLVKAGGTFVPANTLLAAHSLMPRDQQPALRRYVHS